MSLQLITTSNADRNLAAGATVLSATPDASNPRLCYALILLGDGTKNLTTTGGDFLVTITIAGNTYGGGAETYTVGVAPRVAIQTTAFFVPANTAVAIAITSPNAGDTDVDCTAYLVSPVDIDAAGVRAAIGMAAADLDAQLGAIADKTDLIGTGTATVSAPVSETGTIAQIVIGDDYLAANARAFEFTVPAPTGVTLGTSTCTFGGKAAAQTSSYTWSVTGTITDPGGGNWLLSFDLLRADTASLPSGPYKWSVSIRDASSNKITPVISDADTVLVESQS